MSSTQTRPAHSPLGASGAERVVVLCFAHSFRPHPSLPCSACACGVVRSDISGRLLKCRADKNGYRIISFGRRGSAKTVKRHRIVIACFEGEDAREVDHRDRDKTNNAYQNLRYLTSSQNHRNIGVRRHSKSGIRNVRFVPERQKWQAYCTRKGRFTHLAYCRSAEEAREIAQAHYE